MYNVEAGHCVQKLGGHVDHIKGVCFTPKGELVTASLDSTTLVFGMECGGVMYLV